MVPFHFEDHFWVETNFWIGLLFVMFPLNYLIYGLNDYNDFKADEVNSRKGNFLFGAKSNKAQLKKLPKRIAWVVLPYGLFFLGCRMEHGFPFSIYGGHKYCVQF